MVDRDGGGRLGRRSRFGVGERGLGGLDVDARFSAGKEDRIFALHVDCDEPELQGGEGLSFEVTKK